MMSVTPEQMTTEFPTWESRPIVLQLADHVMPHLRQYGIGFPTADVVTLAIDEHLAEGEFSTLLELCITGVQEEHVSGIGTSYQPASLRLLFDFSTSKLIAYAQLTRTPVDTASRMGQFAQRLEGLDREQVDWPKLMRGETDPKYISGKFETGVTIPPDLKDKILRGPRKDALARLRTRIADSLTTKRRNRARKNVSS